MTTGTKTTGTSSTPIYYSKSWSGTDGRGQENNYTMDLTAIRRSKSKLLSYPNFPAQYYASAGGSASSAITWTANDDLKLLNKFASAYKGHEFNLAVAVGEGRETVNMVKNTVLSFGKSIRALKRGQFEQAIKHLIKAPSGSQLDHARKLRATDISSQWLAIQYGWKPLLNDIYEAANAFERFSRDPREVKLKVSYSKRKTGNSSTSPSNWYGHGLTVRSERLTVRLVENLDTAPRSLGLLNPLEVAWELVPFSFVADWFIPIGTYFETVAAIPPSLDFRVTKGRKITFTGSCTGADLTAVGRKIYSPAGFSHSIKTVHVERIPNFQYTPPLPRFQDLTDVYNVDRLKNAIALAHQLFPKAK